MIKYLLNVCPFWIYERSDNFVNTSSVSIILISCSGGSTTEFSLKTISNKTLVSKYRPSIHLSSKFENE